MLEDNTTIERRVTHTFLLVRNPRAIHWKRGGSRKRIIQFAFTLLEGMKITSYRVGMIDGQTILTRLEGQSI